MLTAAGIFLLLLEGGQVHHDWAKILLLIISIALLLSLIFSAALLYSSDILHHRFWKCPNCGGELPLLTMPRTFLTKQRSVQNPDLYDLCVKKQIRCVRLPGSNLLIPSRCPHCGEKFWKYKKRNRQYLSKIQISDIKQIERISITGGKDSPTSQNLSKEEISAFTDWMHQLRFHEEISRKEALSSGAVTYYHIFFLDGSKLTISPGEIMQMNDTYYRMNTEVSTIKPPC